MISCHIITKGLTAILYKKLQAIFLGFKDNMTKTHSIVGDKETWLLICAHLM